MKSFKYTINGNVYKVVINTIEDTIADVEVNGTPYKVEMAKPTKKQVVTIKRPVQTTTPPVARPQTTSGAGAIKSPLPGIILEVNCKAGDAVKKGQKLFVLEAMKMENAINSDRDGTVKEVKVNKGDSILEGADLVIIG
ncbi:MAG: biotin/lipoyl-binding protein [Dysgonamonadaceae bacterium]|jgi:biotin carboxyl carrier protein|nr:biotin/lipoyl-binding protein [Dysgonamonadaceae bacterium]